MDWIDMAQDRYQWRALVNTVMNLRVPYNPGKFCNWQLLKKGSAPRSQLVTYIVYCSGVITYNQLFIKYDDDESNRGGGGSDDWNM
jgi:hypothetical protein